MQHVPREPNDTPFHSGFNVSTVHRNKTRFMINDLRWTSVFPIPTSESEVSKIVAVVPKNLISYRTKRDPVSPLVLELTVEQLENLKEFQKSFDSVVLAHIKAKFATLVRTIHAKRQPPIPLITCQQFHTSALVIAEFRANPSPDLLEVICWSMRLLYYERVHRLILANDLMKSYGLQYLPDTEQTSKLQGFVETAISEKRLSVFRPFSNHAASHDIDFVYSSLRISNMPQRILYALPATLLNENPPMRLPQFHSNNASIPTVVAPPPQHNPSHPPAWQPTSFAPSNGTSTFRFPDLAQLHQQTNQFSSSDGLPLSRVAHHVHQPPTFPPQSFNRPFNIFDSIGAQNLTHHSQSVHPNPATTHLMKESTMRPHHQAEYSRQLVSTTDTGVDDVSDLSSTDDVIVSSDDPPAKNHDDDPDLSPAESPDCPSVAQPIEMFDPHARVSETTSVPRRDDSLTKQKPIPKVATNSKTKKTTSRKKGPTKSGSRTNKSLNPISKARKKKPLIILSESTLKENLPDPVCVSHGCQLDKLFTLPKYELRHFQSCGRFMTNASCLDCSIPFDFASFSVAHYCRECREKFDSTDGPFLTMVIFCNKCHVVRTSLLGRRKSSKKRVHDV